MSSTINLRNRPISLESNLGHALVSDVARLVEKLITTEQLCEKYGLSLLEHQQLKANKELKQNVEAELKQRIRNGVAAQEKAVQEFTATPTVIDNIDPSSLLKNHEFITDCARYSEGLYSELDVKKKHHFDDETWAILGDNDELIEAIETEKVKRVRNGAFKRERAQQLVTKAPNVLDAILMDNSASPKHRIDAAKTLDAFAVDPPSDTQNSSERYVIRINLGADERFERTIHLTPRPNADNTELEVIEPPKKLLTVSAERTDDEDADPI